jgi:predicted acyltransferase
MTTMPESKPRLAALDVFRGLTVAGMLLVNDPGSWTAIYSPLEHAEWFGWTPTDLIFPFFLFIVGITTHLSLSARRARGDGDRELVKQILRRGALILLVGLLMTGFPYHQFYITLPGGLVFDSRTPHLDLAHWRFTGVLQRIALCYTFGALLTLRTNVKQQVAILAVLLYGYWFAMTLIPVPGHGIGALMLGVPDGSIAAWLDRTILTTNHMWVGSKTWDPEGLLSTIPAIGTVILGDLTGRWIATDRPLPEKLNAMFTAGALAMMTGLMWHWSFPIAKNIWTSSYVLFTAGMAALSIAACMWLIDVQKITWWTKPWIIYGTNPLFAFVASGFLGRLLYTLIRVPSKDGLIPLQAWIFNTAFAPWLDPKDASLAFAIAWVMLFMGLLTWLYRRNIVIKL